MAENLQPSITQPQIAPPEKGIESQPLMKDHDQPEDHLVADLSDFVVKHPLGKESRRPATEKLQQVKCALWSPPVPQLGTPLVPPINI